VTHSSNVFFSLLSVFKKKRMGGNDVPVPNDSRSEPCSQIAGPPFAEARNEFEFVPRKETEFDSISFQKGVFWGCSCSRAVTRSRAESEVASLGGFVRRSRNQRAPSALPRLGTAPE